MTNKWSKKHMCISGYSADFSIKITLTVFIIFGVYHGPTNPLCIFFQMIIYVHFFLIYIFSQEVFFWNTDMCKQILEWLINTSEWRDLKQPSLSLCRLSLMLAFCVNDTAETHSCSENNPITLSCSPFRQPNY